MKKTRKILSFMLAIVMVLSAMSLSLVASAIDIQFNASADALWADPDKGLTQANVTDSGNANTFNATVLLDFLDLVLKEVNIKKDIDLKVTTITLDFTSMNKILSTLDIIHGVATRRNILTGKLQETDTIKIALGYNLHCLNWKTGQQRGTTSDLDILNNLITFIGDNGDFVGAFVADKTNIIQLSTILKKDVKTLVKELIAKLITKMAPSYSPNYSQSVDDMILKDALGIGLNSLLAKADEKLKGSTGRLKEIMDTLYGSGFSLEGIIDGYTYDPSLTLDGTIGQIAAIVYGKNTKYIKEMLYTYGSRLQGFIARSEYGAPFAHLLKFDTFTEDSDYSFLEFSSTSVKDLNKFAGQIIEGVTTYDKWDNSRNLGANLTALFKWAIDNRAATENSPYEGYDFSGNTENYALALAKMLVDILVNDEDIKATLASCNSAEEVITILLPTLVNGKDRIVIGENSKTWSQVLGDILGSYLADYAVLYTDANNTRRYVKGSGAGYLDVINYALNYYLVDLNFDTLVGLDLKKNQTALEKLDALQTVIFGTGSGALQYSKASELIPALVNALFDLDLETIVDKGIEKAFIDINTDVKAADLVYRMLNYALGSIFGKTIFTSKFTTIDALLDTAALEAPVNNLLSGLGARKAQLIPVIIYIFSAIDADATFDVVAGTNGNVTVTYAGKTLVKDTDYTVSTSVSEKGVSALVTVSGKGNYGGKVEVVSKCESHVYGAWTVVTAATCTADGTKKAVCICGAEKFDTIQKTGHKISAWKVKTAATCKAGGVEIRTCSACKTTETRPIAKLTTHTYTGSVVVPASPSKDGSITAVCKVCDAKGKVVAISRPATVEIAKSKFTYTGKDIKPTVVVKDAKGNTISANNYTVTYSNNKDVGVATVTVTFKGNYTGTMTITFQITPKGTSVSKATASGSKSMSVKWKKNKSVSGYEVQYSTSKNFKKAVKKAVIKKNKTTAKKISKLKPNKTYYVRIRTYKTVKVDGKNVKIYSTWSKSKKVKL